VVSQEGATVWRWLAVVLIAVGGLGLGYWGVLSANPESAAWSPSPITGGIVLVGGLILLLLDGRRE